MDYEKLKELTKRVHYNATAHGFHEEKKSDAHWLCMIMTEIAEAVEADRKQSRARMRYFEDLQHSKDCGAISVSELWYHEYYPQKYSLFIKGSIEEELADIVIRILDFAYEKFGDNVWSESYENAIPNISLSFTENAWLLLRNILDGSSSGLHSSIAFVERWSFSLGIDLWWHVEAKMKYNETRFYKHDKKY